MNIITAVSEMQAWSDRQRAEGGRIGLVPTMGALHDGHLVLVRKALEVADDVVVSIFVNPTQFGPGEDYDRYPRDIERDVALLEGVDPNIAVFVPALEEMYPNGAEKVTTWVDVQELDRNLCGRHRPGHFRGVTTVVIKLLHASKPHVGVFGLKDAQQFVILRRMAEDLLMDVEIIGVPTVRESDGLAMSSRNAYLTPAQRASAVVVSKAVNLAERRILQGEQRSKALVELMRSTLEGSADLKVQYVEIVDADTLEPVDSVGPGQRILAAVAVYFGETRLIDSTFVRAPAS